MTMTAMEFDLEPVDRLTKDLLQATKTLSPNEARYLVDAYYSVQEYRKAANNQVLAMSKSEEPCETLTWLFRQMETLEKQIQRALNAWTDSLPEGVWAKSIKGVGPVISAGLAAHIDIGKAPTVGHIWRFAGLDPTSEWGKGEKRPWNADLKTLCWKIGECFVKVSGYEDDYYGKVYISRKQWEVAQNEAGAYAAQAASVLVKKNIGKETEAFKHYSAGRLPPAHVHARSKRYAVKLFLSHYQLVSWYVAHEELPPKPYAIEHKGHAHIIPPPNTDLIPGLSEALKRWVG
jgi:hypothetical protein